MLCKNVGHNSIIYNSPHEKKKRRLVNHPNQSARQCCYKLYKLSVFISYFAQLHPMSDIHMGQKVHITS